MIWYIMSSQTHEVLSAERLGKIKLFGLNNKSLVISSIDKSLIILYFSTNCQFCTDEINSISQNIDELQKVKIVLVSSEPLENIVQFATNFDTTNLTFLQDKKGELRELLRVKNYPSIYVFSKEKELIKQYKGLVPINKLIAEISNE